MINQINRDRIAAMKSGDTLKKNLLSTLEGDCRKVNKIPSNEECVAIIKSYIKIINKNLDLFKDKLLHKESWVEAVQERTILESYLPKKMSRNQLKLVVKEFIWARNTAEMKAIQNYLKEIYTDMYNGGDVKSIIDEISAEGKENL